MNSSSETSAADAEPAPTSRPSKIPRRRWGGRLFLFTCLLALLALVGLFLVAFQLRRQQATWESAKAGRQEVLKNLDDQIKTARSEINKIDDRQRLAEGLRGTVAELSRKKTDLNGIVDTQRTKESTLRASIANLTLNQRNLVLPH